MKYSWRWWLEPYLILLGQMLFAFENAHTERCLVWFETHPDQEYEYQRRLHWGLSRKVAGAFWDESVAYAEKAYEQKNHTDKDVVHWYRVTHYWGLIIDALMSGHRG